MRSVGETDGRTPETAMVVIDVAEEYACMRYHDLRPLKPVLSRCGESPCDAVTVRDARSGEELTLYFDVSIPGNHQRRSHDRD